MERSGVIGPDDVDMLTINLITTGSFPPVTEDRMVEVIQKARSELQDRTGSAGCTLELYVNWFEATFIRNESVSIV